MYLLYARKINAKRGSKGHQTFKKRNKKGKRHYLLRLPPERINR
jgi:hypothetical protein